MIGASRRRTGGEGVLARRTAREPPAIGVSPTMARASVDLPEPLSPTMASVVPRCDLEGNVEHRIDVAAGEPGEHGLDRSGDGVAHMQDCGRSSRVMRRRRPTRWQRATDGRADGARRPAGRRRQRSMTTRTARREDAAWRDGAQVGHVARNHRQFARDLGDARRIAFDQRPGVGMLRAIEDVAHRALLDDLAGIEHDDAVADFGDRAEIVRDEEDRAVRAPAAARAGDAESAPRA